jgi:hypothetical protein
MICVCRASPLVRLMLAAALIASAPGSAHAFDRSGARIFELQRDLRTVRPRTLREPRASAFDLRNLERRLHEARLNAPRDPRLPSLELEARELRWQADRSARKAATAGDSPRSAALTGPAPVEQPAYLGGTHALPGAAPAASGFGRRVIALQRRIGEIEARFQQDDAAGAGRLLAAAVADLAVLRGALGDTVADDPNLLALGAQIAALKARLE